MTALHWTPEGKLKGGGGGGGGAAPRDHEVADFGEGNEADEKDMEQHSSHG